LLQQQRRHLAKCLRQNHQPHGLAVVHAQRIGRKNLAPANRLNAGAYDFAEIRRFKHHESNHSRGESANRLIGARNPANDKRHHEIKPGDHQEQRNRAEIVDVKTRQHRQGAVFRQSRQRQQSTQRNAADHRKHQQLESHPKAIEQRRPCRHDLLHYLPPNAISPGTRRYASRRRMAYIRLILSTK